MTPRRPCRRRRNAVFLWALQRLRLQRIAAGEIEPESTREQWFKWTVAAGFRPNLHDYMLPSLLFMAEREAALEATPESTHGEGP